MNAKKIAPHQKFDASPFISVKFQSGPVHDVGINGCRVEDVIEVLLGKLKRYQLEDLACPENEMAIKHLEFALQALVQRRKTRQEQGVFDTHQPHKSLFEHRTEDVEAEFSATGS